MRPNAGIRLQQPQSADLRQPVENDYGGREPVAATNVTVNGSAASRYADNTYAKDSLTLTNGSNAFTVIAQDSQGRADTNVLTGSFPTTVNFTFDTNGNLTSDGLRGFDYDDENRLTRIT